MGGVLAVANIRGGGEFGKPARCRQIGYKKMCLMIFYMPQSFLRAMLLAIGNRQLLAEDQMVVYWLVQP